MKYNDKRLDNRYKKKDKDLDEMINNKLFTKSSYVSDPEDITILKDSMIEMKEKGVEIKNKSRNVLREAQIRSFDFEHKVLIGGGFDGGDIKFPTSLVNRINYEHLLWNYYNTKQKTLDNEKREAIFAHADYWSHVNTRDVFLFLQSKRSPDDLRNHKLDFHCLNKKSTVSILNRIFSLKPNSLTSADSIRFIVGRGKHSNLTDEEEMENPLCKAVREWTEHNLDFKSLFCPYKGNNEIGVLVCLKKK